jgi:hypothetical protein
MELGLEFDRCEWCDKETHLARCQLDSDTIAMLCNACEGEHYQQTIGDDDDDDNDLNPPHLPD